jgi:hypothetical protein
MSTKLPPVHKTPRGQNSTEESKDDAKNKSCNDDNLSTGSSSKKTPRPPPSECKSKTAIDHLNDQLEFLKEQLEEQRKVRRKVEKRLEDAREKEALHYADKRKTRVADARRNEAARTIQAALRGYFIRRYMASTIDASTVQLKAAIAADPEILPDQLQSLGQSIHDLVFQEQDRDQAAMTIQCWWRMVLGQRLFRVNWIAEKVRAVGVRFDSAATSIQSWWRGQMERRQYLELIREVTEASRRRMVEETDRHLRCVLRVQRVIRGHLARKEAEKRKGRFAGAGEDASTGALAKTAPAGVPWPKPPVQPSEKKRAEFENLANNGLIPFYWTATEVVRHKIGGHSWLGSNHNMARKGLAQDNGDDLGEELYDVYPEGISEDFRGLLTVDDEKKKKRRRKKSRKPLPPVVINYQECWKARPVPSNSEIRAQARAARKANLEESEEVSFFEEPSTSTSNMGEAHPLLFFHQPLLSCSLD